MLSFYCIPEKDLAGLDRDKQLHLLDLPNQVDYLCLVFYCPHLL